MKAISKIKVTKWEEKNFGDNPEMHKFTEASVVFDVQGDLEGQANVEYLMYYNSFDAKEPLKSSANYVGLIHFVGKINGKNGSLVFEDRGIFEGGAAKSELKIILGSGTAELVGVHGFGKYTASHTESVFEIDYGFET
ncbi:MAG: DUF3224 domain-containing protein [Pseudobdellovibrio sp.]